MSSAQKVSFYQEAKDFYFKADQPYITPTNEQLYQQLYQSEMLQPQQQQYAASGYSMIQPQPHLQPSMLMTTQAQI